MNRFRVLACAFALGASGCVAPSTPPGGNTDGGGTGGGLHDMAAHPPGCSGSLAGALNGRFASCTVSVTQDVNDQILELIPSAWNGDPISTFQIAIVVPKGITPGSYATQMLGDGTIVSVTDRATAARYTAGAPNGPFVGSITLDVLSAPQNPGTDQTWADTHAHGTVSAQLPHDPDSAGSDANSVTLTASF